MHGIANDVESCVQRVELSLKQLKAFINRHSPAFSGSTVETAIGGSSSSLPTTSWLSSADVGIPILGTLSQQSRKLSAPAGKVWKRILARLVHLDALTNSRDQATPVLPTELHTVRADHTPDAVAPNKPSPDTANDIPTGDNRDGKKKEGSTDQVYLGIGNSGVVLLLSSLVCCGAYSSGKRARWFNMLRHVVSSRLQN